MLLHGARPGILYISCSLQGCLYCWSSTTIMYARASWLLCRSVPGGTHHACLGSRACLANGAPRSDTMTPKAPMFFQGVKYCSGTEKDALMMLQNTT